MGPRCTDNFAEASAVQIFLFVFKPSPAVFAHFNAAAQLQGRRPQKENGVGVLLDKPV